jgi:hypothetical protein
MKGSSSAGAAEHWTASAGAAATSCLLGAGASASVPSKCADNDLFAAPEGFKADGAGAAAADEDAADAWAAMTGAAWAAFAAAAWAVFSAFFRICSDTSSLNSIAGANDD